MRRQQVSKPRPLFEGETYLSVVALLLCGRQGKTCLLAPVTRTVNCCWSATLPRGLEGASIVCVGLERNLDRVPKVRCLLATQMFPNPEESCESVG